MYDDAAPDRSVALMTWTIGLVAGLIAAGGVLATRPASP
jgi:hypothetical protein